MMQEVALVVGAAIAVGGWVASGYLARRALRRQTQVDFLLSAYRRLADAVHRDLTAEHERALESAISDIQLLGSRRQVEFAHAFTEEFAAGGETKLDLLLEDLRASLRREMDLDQVTRGLLWLRITREPGRAIRRGR